MCRPPQEDASEDDLALHCFEAGGVPAPGQLVAWDVAKLEEGVQRQRPPFLDLLPKCTCRPVRVRTALRTRCSCRTLLTLAPSQT